MIVLFNDSPLHELLSMLRCSQIPNKVSEKDKESPDRPRDRDLSQRCGDQNDESREDESDCESEHHNISSNDSGNFFRLHSSSPFVGIRTSAGQVSHRNIEINVYCFPFPLSFHDFSKRSFPPHLGHSPSMTLTSSIRSHSRFFIRGSRVSSLSVVSKSFEEESLIFMKETLQVTSFTVELLIDPSLRDGTREKNLIPAIDLTSFVDLSSALYMIGLRCLLSCFFSRDQKVDSIRVRRESFEFLDLVDAFESFFSRSKCFRLHSTTTHDVKSLRE